MLNRALINRMHCMTARQLMTRAANGSTDQRCEVQEFMWLNSERITLEQSHLVENGTAVWSSQDRFQIAVAL